MARIKSSLAKVLMLYLVLLPLLGMRTDASSKRAARAPQTIEAPVTIDPPRPGDPPAPHPGQETVFTPGSEPVTLRAFNGFSSDATPGLFSHHGHGHSGGIVNFASPWGEEMKLRYWFTPHGITLEYDDDLKVRYRYDDDGGLEEIVAETPERQARMAVGKRAELAFLGQRDFTSFDMSAYLLVDEALRAKHSEAFLEGLKQFDGAAEVSCFSQGVECAACLVSWAASLAAISSACTAGGVVTFGTACLLAILAHEALNFQCATKCKEWMENCLGGAPSGGRIPQGCEP